MFSIAQRSSLRAIVIFAVSPDAVHDVTLHQAFVSEGSAVEGVRRDLAGPRGHELLQTRGERVFVSKTVLLQAKAYRCSAAVSRVCGDLLENFADRRE